MQMVGQPTPAGSKQTTLEENSESELSLDPDLWRSMSVTIFLLHTYIKEAFKLWQPWD